MTGDVLVSRGYHVRVDGYTDSLGRTPFTLVWEDPDGIWRPEMLGDEPVGYRRSQCFRANLASHVERLRRSGHTVTIESRGYAVPDEASQAAA